MNRKGNPNQREMKFKRIEWLVKNAERFDLIHYDWGFSRFDSRFWEKLQAIIAEMTEAELFSPKTYWKDINLNNLIRETQKQIRMRKRERTEVKTMKFSEIKKEFDNKGFASEGGHL